MKLGRTLIILWMASLVLFSATLLVSLAAPEMLSGVAGLALRFLLGYCAIIVVAQTHSALVAIRRRSEDLSTKQPVSASFLLP